MSDHGARTAAYVRAGGFKGQDAIIALAVAKGESSWNPKAFNGSDPSGGSFGLFQINGVHKPTENQKWNPVDNSMLAYKVFVDAGNTFKPWSVFTSGAYKQHMNDAQRAWDDMQAKGNAWYLRTVNEVQGTGPAETESQLDKIWPDNPLTGTMRKAEQMLDVSLGMILGVVLIVLGIVLLGRNQIGNVVPMGKVAGVAKKVLK